MINIQDRHLEILKSILSNYDYGFFLFGSRISKNVKKFSDIDILYFEKIPNAILLALEEELEESDLPYKVDLVDYNQCDNDFKEIINNNYVCLQASSKLQLIERNHLNHFEFLSKILGFEVLRKNGLHIINCALRSSMFNIVYGAPSSHESLDLLIATVKDNFKGQPFAWWVPPSLKNLELSEYLVKAGLVTETVEHAMICDLNIELLSGLKTDLIVRPVLDSQILEDFIKLLEPYDIHARKFYEKLTNKHLQLCEKLFVGYSNNHAVTIGILSELESVSGIFSLLTQEKEQNKGYGTDMVQYLLQVAKNNGSHYATLSASSDSGYRIYERFGFQKIGEFECFEYLDKLKN